MSRARALDKLKEERRDRQRKGQQRKNKREGAQEAFTAPEKLAQLSSRIYGKKDTLRRLPLGLTAPVFVMAPMVKQSGRAFRDLVRAHGCTVCYSEMLMADKYATDAAYRQEAFGSHIDEADHPLVVQFAANDPEELLQASLQAQRQGLDAVDLNLGCPQPRAREGPYGAWFASDPENWPRIAEMVRACASSRKLAIPLFCKIRLQPTLEATVEFATLLQDAGCALLAIHGRFLGGENRQARRQGAADLAAVKHVRAALRIPVLSNGNIRSTTDVFANLKFTGCEGIMCAEQLLRDPALFERALFEDSAALGQSDEDGDAAVSSVEELADEFLVRSHHCHEAGEQFTVWNADNYQVVKMHMKAIYAGKVVGGGDCKEEWFLTPGSPAEGARPAPRSQVVRQIRRCGCCARKKSGAKRPSGFVQRLLRQLSQFLPVLGAKPDISACRERLTAEVTAPAVGSIALARGFWHSGCF